MITEKIIKLGKYRIKFLDTPRTTMIQINLNRYKKNKEIDTWTVYNGIFEKHLPDDIWADIQDNKLIGIEIHVAKK